MKKWNPLAREQWLEILFGGFVLSIWMTWAYILPFNEGPDEYMRSMIVKYMIEYGKLPTGYQKEILDSLWGFTYGFRPILPQILEAFFLRIGMLFTEDRFLLLYAGRMASILCGLVFLQYIKAISRYLFQRRDFQWLFVILTICMPQVSFLFTYLNCDSMALMATAMIIYYLLLGIKTSFSYSVCTKLSLSLSICIMSYYNAYGFLITSVLVFIGVFLARNHRGESCWLEFWKKGFFILAIVILLTGWWFVRNYFLYDGDILGLRTQNIYAERYAIDILKPSNRLSYRNQGLSIWAMLFHSNWAYSVLQSFIGVLGPLFYPVSKWTYLGYGLLFAVGGFGILAEALNILRKKEAFSFNWVPISLHLGFIIAIFVPNALNVWYSYATDYQPQGRYSMPMLVPFMYYVVRGCLYWFQKIKLWGQELCQKILLWTIRGICLWSCVVLLGCVTNIMWPAYKDVKDKSVVKTYTAEELFDEK